MILELDQVTAMVGAQTHLYPTSLRLAPGQDPLDAQRALHEHLQANAPWGATVTVTPGMVGAPFALDPIGAPVPCAPCGACRQAIIEFGPDADVSFGTEDAAGNDINVTVKAEALLPGAFSFRPL